MLHTSAQWCKYVRVWLVHVVQISLKWGGRVYNGVINAIPEQHAATGRQHPRHTGSGFIDAAPGSTCTYLLTDFLTVLLTYCLTICLTYRPSCVLTV